MPRLSSFALTKASLGAFLGGAILPDSMLSCHSSSGERGLLASSSLRLHPCGVRKAGLQRQPGWLLLLSCGSTPWSLRAAELALEPRAREVRKRRVSLPWGTLGQHLEEPRSSSSGSCSPVKCTKWVTLVFSGTPSSHLPCCYSGPFHFPAMPAGAPSTCPCDRVAWVN